jgi:NTE family protein
MVEGMEKTTKIKTLICSGGGIRGVSYVGVFKRLEEQHYLDLDIKILCAVSAGSIFGLMYILGYTADDMMTEVMAKNFSALRDIQLGNVLTKYGIETGDNIISWIETLMIRKGISKEATFKELYDATNIEFQVCATNISKYTYEVFNYKSQPNMKITKAIRISIGIPFVFTAETYNGDMYVDGGVINSYPIDLFEDNLEGVLGIKLEHEDKLARNEREGLDNYIFNVINCFVIHRERQDKKSCNNNLTSHTLRVQSGDVAHTLKFSLSRHDKTKLIQSGYNCTDAFLNSMNIN